MDIIGTNLSLNLSLTKTKSITKIKTKPRLNQTSKSLLVTGANYVETQTKLGLNQDNVSTKSGLYSD